MALEEDKATGNWKERSVCMGDKETCSFPGLVNHYHKFIISFAEDEAGDERFPLPESPSGNNRSHASSYVRFQGSCTSWPPRTPATRLRLEPFSNSWILPGFFFFFFPIIHVDLHNTDTFTSYQTYRENSIRFKKPLAIAHIGTVNASVCELNNEQLFNSFC